MKMANEHAPQRLTLDDPVGKEVIEKLSELEMMQVNAAMHLMGIKREEVRLLAVDRKVEDERHKMFERLLMERGLPPSTPATIDFATGKVHLMKPSPGPDPVATATVSTPP
jgi:hypothetical protein